MKKILPILMALFLVLPITNAFAYDGYNDGLLNGMKMNFGKGPSDIYTTSGSPTDNDLSTSARLSANGGLFDVMWISLPSSTTINSYYFMGDYNFRGTLVLYGPNDIELSKINPKINVKTTIEKITGVRKIAIINGDSLTHDVVEFNVFLDAPITYDSVTTLTETHNYNLVNLKWINPTGSSFEGLIIKKDGVEVSTLAKTAITYSLINLNPETLYHLEVIAKYSGGRFSEPVSIEVTTDKAPPPLPPPEPAGDISKLKADADYDRVDLSWTLPASDNFKHVNIYRDTLDKSLLDKLLGVRSVKAATPIFETNGTYFNDLTVQSETKYEYLLTTTSAEGLESDGVSTTVTTLKKPEPEIEGGGYEKDPETGDFTYTWTKPTTGKVKVMIDGKLHATVEGSTGKIIIPAADMKYTLFGKPDVQLIPVDEDGEEGKPVKPPSGGGSESGGSDAVEMPFSALELLKTTFDFIKIIGPFILLFLIIYLTPQIIKVIRMAILRKGIGGKGNDE